MANSKLMAFVIVAAMLLMPSSVVAASISISSVSLPATVNQGDTFTTTMSVSGSSVSSVSGTLTLPSGLSCTPTSSQTISLDSSGVGTGSWSCTASVAGDYTNQITAGVSATDSSTGSSVSDSKQSGLRVLSPASLSVTSSIVAGSV
ncbi:MAG: PGF-CTERM sorting domain-containing protein, partial [Candidatus Aenigmarchaeota archaeon]|nr:PGF-CTERM sorting domain-containing protein [Candidatus Aenigmarchaeota archaeon]